MKKITKTTLIKWEACTECYKRFCELFPNGAVLSVASDGLIKDGNKAWSDWLWSQCKSDYEYCDQTTVTGGDGATVTGGYMATVTGGYMATVTGGDGATVTGGDEATVTGGDWATVTGGDGATVTGGDGACLVLKHFDSNKGRYFVRSANVGENGIKANVPYKLSEDGTIFVEASK